MLQLQNITITHFKNYAVSKFEFHKKIVAISGLNGTGKTNLLDAVYYTCFTKSYFTSQDNANASFGQEGFRLEANFENHGERQKVICVNKTNAKKELSLNDVSYDRLAEHIGAFPAVMIAPDDINIITGSSEGRRKFIDTLLCQTDKIYLKQLMIYNKLLLQRNSLLKSFAETGKTDQSLLDIIDFQLQEPALTVFTKRKTLMEQMLPLVQKIYHDLASNSEEIDMLYESSLINTTFPDILRTNQLKDKMAQRTTDGIHRDDISFTLNKQIFKNIASQGQRKSLLFALKLASFQILKQIKFFSPILLLDDVFEKLDENRITELLTKVCVQNNGQVFITDTHFERMSKIFNKLGLDYQSIEIGEVVTE